MISLPCTSWEVWYCVGSSRTSALLGHLNWGLAPPVPATAGIASISRFVLALWLLLRLCQRRNPISARANTPHGTATPAAIATVWWLFDGAAEATTAGVELAAAGVEVADAATVEAIPAGDGDAVAFGVVEAARSRCQSRSPIIHTRSLDVPAVVVEAPDGTPKAQYPSKTEMALPACADHICELHDTEMADVIRLLNWELESVQKQV